MIGREFDTTFYDELQEQAAPAWPYPVNYGKENEVDTDVLIIGGGIAGCHAAKQVSERGLKVAMVDKASIIRCGRLRDRSISVTI